ncbi:DUF3732 domain-containing protein [Metabacillus sp. HB246100]
MNFNIRNILLWCENGTLRNLIFKENKINVITGDSGTGKTAIWSIVDYCMLNSDKFNIPEKTIGESVSWYGIRIEINGKMYTIGRNSFLATKDASKLFYFSGEGVIPQKPEDNIRSKDLRKIIESEFSIDNNVKVPYGGKVIKKGSKVSFRYFLLFVAQTQNIIINDEVYFPKQSIPKYSEALDRIFDMALTIDNIEETLVREKISELERNKRRLERKQDSMELEVGLFNEEISELVRKAKEYSLIDENISDYKKAYDELKKVIENPINALIYKEDYETSEYDNLLKQQVSLKRKVKNLKSFNIEYAEYKSLLNKNYDSLKPIEVMKNNQSELISDEITNRFIGQLDNQLRRIKEKVSKKSPISIKVNEEIKEYEEQLKEVDRKLSLFNKPLELSHELNSNFDRLVTLGEIKAKVDLFKDRTSVIDYSNEINLIDEDIEALSVGLTSHEDRKSSILTWLEELIQEYLDESKDALGNYAGYRAVFNYSDKTLKLREPKTPNIIDTVGSSSNDLFLHICLFLGLHDLFLQAKSPFVPNFLFLDQPSRPYYEDGKPKEGQELKGTDREKISIAFRVLNYFMRKALNRGDSFQMIIVEHIPPEIWEEQGLECVHLVEEFRNGNYLINKENIK